LLLVKFTKRRLLGEHKIMPKTDTPLVKIDASQLRLNGKKLKGRQLTVSLICRNEEGARVEVPVDLKNAVQLSIKSVSGIRNLQHYAGQLRVRSAYIDQLLSSGEVHTDAPYINNLVCEQAVLGRTHRIGTCYSATHINPARNLINVHKEPMPRDLPPHISDMQNLAKSRQAITLPSDASTFSGAD